jgi:hypothetical protein
MQKASRSLRWDVLVNKASKNAGQAARELAMNSIRSGTFQMLEATDVPGRAIEVDGVTRDVTENVQMTGTPPGTGSVSPVDPQRRESRSR